MACSYFIAGTSTVIQTPGPVGYGMGIMESMPEVPIGVCSVPSVTTLCDSTLPPSPVIARTNSSAAACGFSALVRTLAVRMIDGPPG